MTKKSYCKRLKAFYGDVTVTDRGQIAIPKDLREELGIKKGDKLLAIKRQDCSGLNLIKGDAIEKFLEKMSGD